MCLHMVFIDRLIHDNENNVVYFKHVFEYSFVNIPEGVCVYTCILVIAILKKSR